LKRRTLLLSMENGVLSEGEREKDNVSPWLKEKRVQKGEGRRRPFS